MSYTHERTTMFDFPEFSQSRVPSRNLPWSLGNREEAGAIEYRRKNSAKSSLEFRRKKRRRGSGTPLKHSLTICKSDKSLSFVAASTKFAVESGHADCQSIACCWPSFGQVSVPGPSALSSIGKNLPPPFAPVHFVRRYLVRLGPPRAAPVALSAVETVRNIRGQGRGGRILAHEPFLF